ncbi:MULTISPECIES: hypothetical protein [unclassified Blastococcus]
MAVSRVGAAAVGAAAVLALAGCASAQEDDVRDVATAFGDRGVDPGARCELLVATTRAALESDESAPCAAVLADLPLGGGAVESVAVWGRNAQVRTTEDTLFLAETAAGWRVAAAGCTPRGEAPYDCEVEGP